jgi:hypothetical protein
MIVGRFLTGKMKALKYLDETYSAKWPPVVRQLNGAQLLGHAYSSRSLDSLWAFISTFEPWGDEKMWENEDKGYAYVTWGGRLSIYGD